MYIYLYLLYIYIHTHMYFTWLVFWQNRFRPWNHGCLSGLQKDLDNWQLCSRPERTRRACDYRCLLAVTLISVGLYFNALPRSTKRETVSLCRFPVEKLHQSEGGKKRHQLSFHPELMWSAVSEKGRGGLFQFRWNQDFQSLWAVNSSPSFLLFLPCRVCIKATPLIWADQSEARWALDSTASQSSCAPVMGFAVGIILVTNIPGSRMEGWVAPGLLWSCEARYT